MKTHKDLGCKFYLNENARIQKIDGLTGKRSEIVVLKCGYCGEVFEEIHDKMLLKILTPSAKAKKQLEKFGVNVFKKKGCT